MTAANWYRQSGFLYLGQDIYSFIFPKQILKYHRVLYRASNVFKTIGSTVVVRALLNNAFLRAFHDWHRWRTVPITRSAAGAKMRTLLSITYYICHFNIEGNRLCGVSERWTCQKERKREKEREK
jgi:hypothetical protein